jgi:hypothetical protein
MDHGDQVGTSLVCPESWTMTILRTLGHCIMVHGDLDASMVCYVWWTMTILNDPWTLWHGPWWSSWYIPSLSWVMDHDHFKDPWPLYHGMWWSRYFHGLLCVMDHDHFEWPMNIVTWSMTILMTLGHCTMVHGDLGTSMVCYVLQWTMAIVEWSMVVKLVHP